MSKCPECKGKGEVPCPMEYGGQHPENCPVCAGDARYRGVCQECNGTGKQGEH